MAVKSSIRAQKKMHRVLSVITLMTILLAACGGGTIHGGSPTPTSEQDWRTKIERVPLPKKGCFEATSPSRQWAQVACTTTPSYPQPPSRGPRPNTVGNNNDVSAQVSTGFISTAV